MRGDKRKIHILEGNENYNNGKYKIVDENPENYNVFYFANM